MPHSTAGDAAGYAYKGTVAFAPFNSIEASVGLIDAFAAADPANLAAYRTQTTTLIADAPITLRLRREQLDALMTRNEIFLSQD